jgi:glycosyltransferase involved in cell wall biosynthesis
VDAETLAVARGREVTIIAGGTGPVAHRSADLIAIKPRWPAAVSKLPPVRFDVGWQQYLELDAFDRAAARRLRQAPEAVIAFAGQALHTFRRARTIGCKTLELISPTAHLSHVWRQHRTAARRYPLERDWLSRAHLERALDEYAMADIIHVASSYTWDSFVREGISASKLVRMPVSASSRFTPAARNRHDSDRRFQVVYTGILSVVKGTPLLLDAFARLADPDARLVLVGATGSRGMRQFVDDRRAVDRRVCLAPGDPLPHLAAATVYVHPSYQDGFAYAVAEALACGLPVIVSEDTGAKELVVGGENGEVIPTDNVEALAAAIARRHSAWLATPRLQQ